MTTHTTDTKHDFNIRLYSKLKWISQMVTLIQITTVMSNEDNKKSDMEIKGTMKT